MSVKLPCTVVVLFLIALFVGCGKNSVVTGKVTFPDGSPLTEGNVLFESPEIMAKGVIQKDGSYAMFSGELKGVPKGNYQVTIGVPMEKITPSGVDGVPPTIVPLDVSIDKKYFSPATSGLTCKVKGRTKFNITVEKPAN